MNFLRIFFAELWPVLLGVGLVLVGLWFAGRFASHSYFLFTSPKSFNELAGYSEDEQKRLLQVASKETFRCWWSVLPSIAFALVFSGGIALGMTLPKVTALPDTWWVHTIVAALLAGEAGWLVMRLAVSCVRPHLQRLIARTSHVA
jgi:hypothetical protein